MHQRVRQVEEPGAKECYRQGVAMADPVAVAAPEWRRKDRRQAGHREDEAHLGAQHPSRALFQALHEKRQDRLNRHQADLGDEHDSKRCAQGGERQEHREGVSYPGAFLGGHGGKLLVDKEGDDNPGHDAGGPGD